MELPRDPAILLGFLNLKLRDYYSSLQELCEDLGADEETLLATMQAYGYRYNAAENRFVAE